MGTSVSQEQSVPPGIDPSIPNVARMYDYVLGGKDNYAADRELAGHLIASIPDGVEALRGNRRFLGRAVAHVAEQGIDQFIDLGAGLPNQGNVHEIAQRVHPHARVVYVDIDPVVITHARALLAADDRTAAIQADMRDPRAVLDSEAVARLIDFDRPVGVIFNAMLHFVTEDEDPAGIVAAFTDVIAPGSHLVISHSTVDDRPADLVEIIESAYENASAPMVFRAYDGVLRLFNGLTLVEPGLVKVNRWRADAAEAAASGGAWVYGGVAVK
ncbi:SAM-dependent methyltransferase [Actinomadura sp. 7K507]|uniref:SAM-dependent methyltransferase n=1 Tax=Actinomadura sp. 7K507 TaxID=2530365 RepID=UPI0010475C7D|nr:SAM-dependent methyltransferase [Actinomadura sp. 7K507]TDC89921.1 SAM-dependent methyltransferase [Actinomadura sp. 7K507]